MNAQLEHWISNSGLTKKELARRVQTRAHAKGLSHVSTAASRVRGWIAGQQPAEAEVASVIAEVLSEACRQPLTSEDLGFQSQSTQIAISPAGLTIIPRLADAVESQSRMDLILSAHDLNAEKTGIAYGESLLDVVEHVALGRPAPLPEPVSPFRIDNRYVSLIEQATNTFRRWDNEFGGGLRRKSIIGQLNEASFLLGGPFRDEQVGRRFFPQLPILLNWLAGCRMIWNFMRRHNAISCSVCILPGTQATVRRLLGCYTVLLGR